MKFTIIIFLTCLSCGTIKKSDKDSPNSTAVENSASNAKALSETTVTLGPDLQSCTGMAPMKCMVVEKTSDSKFIEKGLFYHSIENFAFVQGIRRSISVRVYPVENPPADASSLRFVFIRDVD